MHVALKPSSSLQQDFLRLVCGVVVPRGLEFEQYMHHLALPHFLLADVQLFFEDWHGFARSDIPVAETAGRAVVILVSDSRCCPCCRPMIRRHTVAMLAAVPLPLLLLLLQHNDSYLLKSEELIDFSCV